MNHYRASKSAFKSSVRDIIFKEVCEHLNKQAPISSLTLPNLNIDLEKSLCNTFSTRYRKHTIIFCEKDRETCRKLYYRSSAIISDEVDSECILGDVFDMDFSKWGHFNFVWLDLCSSYSEYTIEKIADFANRFYNSGGRKSVFALTLNNQRGVDPRSMYISSVYPKYKQQGIVQHLCNIMEGNVKEVSKIDYRCSDISAKSCQMSTFIFKIQRHEIIKGFSKSNFGRKESCRNEG